VATKTIQFFATNSDLRAVLDAVEARCGIQYIECGLFDVADRPAFATLRLGPADYAPGSANCFLVFPRDRVYKVRTVAQRRGGPRYAVDQMVNPGTVVLNPGIDMNESVLVAGTVGTIHRDNTSSALMQTFAAEVKSRFQRIKGYWVGPQAKARLGSGARLTHSVTAPPEYDLSLS
jgi:hypothetical protein